MVQVTQITKSQTTKIVDHLIRRCRESEHGFLVAAENVSNLGLKAILKTYAQERHEFALEIEEAIGQQRETRRASESWLSSIHRGWIGLRATMTLGESDTEHVVLSEVLRGEGLTARSYQNDLENGDFPPMLKAILQRQFEQIQEDREHLMLLQGNNNDQMVVRLFDEPEHVAEAKAALERAGFATESIEQHSVAQMLRSYNKKSERSTMAEQVLATTLLGAAFLGPLGLVIGFSLHTVPASADAVGLSLWATILMTTFIGVMTGGGLGAFFGLLLGKGISEEDTHLYKESMEHGNVMVQVRTSTERAREASLILQKVNASARSQQMIA